MTEFKLSENCKWGLMPNNAIAKILSDKTPPRWREHPARAKFQNQIPKPSELIRDFKGFTSRQIIKAIQENNQES